MFDVALNMTGSTSPVVAIIQQNHEAMKEVMNSAVDMVDIGPAPAGRLVYDGEVLNNAAVVEARILPFNSTSDVDPVLWPYFVQIEQTLSSL